MEKLLEILKKIKPGIDYEKKESLVDDGILDSIEIVEIIMEIEDVFGIEIMPEKIDPDNFQSVHTIWNLIQEELGGV